ncbi:MAG: peptidylprolyl isomerase [Bacteroidales bacterium]|nr:peptidylprolyl isomerase [Bacteroidales bacterium]
MKKYIFLALSLALAALLAASCGNKKKAAAEAEAAQAAAEVEQAKQDSIKVEKKFSDLAEEPIFDLVTNYGTIKIKLYKNTPKHRENFAKLALSGFYDGILFHRVINGFMIQGGDPLTKDPANADRFGTGGPGYTVPAEFVPEYVHKKGALAAARRGDAANPMKESSGSQFYIVQNAQTCAQLDGDYTVFGETVEGFDVIDKIAAVETDRRDRPVAQVKIISVKPE